MFAPFLVLSLSPCVIMAKSLHPLSLFSFVAGISSPFLSYSDSGLRIRNYSCFAYKLHAFCMQSGLILHEMSDVSDYKG